MTTAAKSIEILAKHADQAVEMAEERAIAVNQDWVEARTSYIFADNSVLVVSGPDYFEQEGAGA